MINIVGSKTIFVVKLNIMAFYSTVHSINILRTVITVCDQTVKQLGHTEFIAF